jgi:hypothetical protein
VLKISFYVVIGSILLTGCKQSVKNHTLSKTTDSLSLPNTSSEPFSITTASKNDFNRCKQRDYITYDTLLFRKKNGTLKLPTSEKWKPFVIFSDSLVDSDDDKEREFRYLGQFKEIGYYIVSGNFYEHSEDYLIDKNSASQTVIWNDPKISPGREFIANLSMSYGLEGEPNGVQIWRVIKDENNEADPITISKILEIDQQIWVPDDFVWETKNTLILKVIPVAKFWDKTGNLNKNPSDFYYLRIKVS